MYKRFWLEGMAPWGLAQEKRSVCINTAGQNIIRTISLLALLPGLSHCLEEAKSSLVCPQGTSSPGAGDCSPAAEVRRPGESSGVKGQHLLSR